MSLRIVHRERVRFRDCDSLGHVNNAVYLTYLEEARVDLRNEFGFDWTQMILARCEIDFRDQVDRALLVDANAGAELGDLEIAGAHDGFHGRREKLRVGLGQPSSPS